MSENAQKLFETDVNAVYENEFSGMAIDKVSLEAFLQTGEKLAKMIRQDLTENERKFIISIKMMKPDWQLLGLHGIEKLACLTYLSLLFYV